MTGSIGVFTGKLDLSAFLKSIGIHIDSKRYGLHSGVLSLFSSWNEEEKAHLQKSVDQVYDLFLDRVLIGRSKKLNRESLLAVAGGRVWTGKQAFKRGLVDQMGGLLDAITWTRKKLGLTSTEFDLKVFVPKKEVN